jgi:PAS domain S-box-containing protein
MLLDRKGMILLGNKAFAAYVGRKGEDLVGHSSYACLSSSMAEVRRQKLEEILRLGKPQVVEETHKDSTFITTLYPVFDESGMVSRVAVVHRDISPLKRTEARLKESEVLYRNIVESASDGIVIIEEGKVSYANRRMENMGGYLPGEALGVPVTQFIHPAELARVIEHLRQRKGNDDYRAKYETILKDKSGRDVFVEINSSALSIHPGKDATLVMIRDISARKQSEQALREAEGKYRRLVDQSLAGIYITAEGRMKFCNRKFAEIFGYERPDDMIGIEISKLIAPESLSLVEHQVKLREIGHVDSVNYEFRAVRRDGTIFDVEVFGTRFDDKGQPAILGTIIDITERKKAARSLAETNTRLQALLQAMPDVVYFKDLEGRNLTVNKAFETMVGLPSDRILGKKDEDIFPP